MFVYYEKFPEDKISNSPAVTLVVMSSNGADNVINWKNTKDKAMIDMLRSLLKQVPLSEREYDETTHVWTIIGFRGDVIIEGIKSMITQGLFNTLEVKEIEDLEEKNIKRCLNRQEVFAEGNKKFKDEDFFYNKVTISQPLSGADLLIKLAPLLEVTTDYLTNESDDNVLKKLYRKAALRLHPDRNQGDGSKMSELNMLWNIFMQQV